jgi:MFS family permease
MLSTYLVRTAEQMWQVGLVLFVLQRFHSPELTGFTVFLALAPGIMVSPIAGALLDRRGRVRLMQLDYLVAGSTMVVIAVASLLGRLTPVLLLPVVAVSSLTFPLGQTGSRSLFALLVPPRYWDRANALDSSGYAVSSIAGPALVGVLFGVVGAEYSLLCTSALFALSAVSMIGLRDPIESRANPGSLLSESAAALRYVLGHPTLRALALALSLQNVGWGIILVGLPVLVLHQLHGSPVVVGQLLAAGGVATVAGGLLSGRISSEGRERNVMAVTLFIVAGGYALLAFSSNLVMVAASMLVIGLAVGPLDVALFSVRQRRTDRAWLGRAFAVSMALNFCGMPVGSGISGPLIHFSLQGALLIAAGFGALAAVIALVAIPAGDDQAARVLSP